MELIYYIWNVFVTFYISIFNRLCLSDYMKTIIRYLRQEIKMSQQDLAESVGVTRQTINALENGRYNPSLLLAYKITRILNEATYGEDTDSYQSIEDIFKFSDDEL